MRLNVKKLNARAIVPKYDHPGDAGMGLFSIEEKTLVPGERYLFPTGIAVEIPEGYVGLVWERSGLSNNHGLSVLGGVIDSSYRGEIKVGLLNNSAEHYMVKVGDKIAQILIQPVARVDVVETDDLSGTTRGDQGFGSTGR